MGNLHGETHRSLKQTSRTINKHACPSVEVSSTRKI